MLRSVTSALIHSPIIRQSYGSGRLVNKRWTKAMVRRTFSSSEDEFTKHVALSKTLKDDPGNEAKLQLYALYKQATIGTNTTPKPGAMDIVGKYKWQAWATLGTMSKEDASKEYVSMVQKLIKEIGSTTN